MTREERFQQALRKIGLFEAGPELYPKKRREGLFYRYFKRNRPEETTPGFMLVYRIARPLWLQRLRGNPLIAERLRPISLEIQPVKADRFTTKNRKKVKV